MIVQTYYISTGRKGAFYTLRCRRDAVGASAAASAFMPDFYVCTLAADETRAAEKAAVYVEAMRERIGESDTFQIVFDDAPEREAFKRRGRLSVRDTRTVERIEAGFFPFGKHAETPIAEAPDAYLLYWADKIRDAEQDYVKAALAAACMGAALEKGLIAKRDAARAERAALDAQSNFLGTVGERRDFTGEVVTAYQKDEFSPWITKVRCGDDLVTYVGNKALGTLGAVITFRATIKKHDEYKGVRSTQVSRPM
ncbi:hypothetical protein [Cupriavidus sp. TMH.W2]|uniref:hypothetical protein n=1 Tax=Cupriavidus sp. TMH.W2 TaxID=3434465 RepID=UPI003D773A93